MFFRRINITINNCIIVDLKALLFLCISKSNGKTRHYNFFCNVLFYGRIVANLFIN
jgi:hypothetical protein